MAAAVTTYSYDSRGRLRTIDNPYAETTTYSYDALSRSSRQDNDNGTYATWAYNAAGWMTGVTNKKSDATVISGFTYSYDDVGNRTGVTEANGDKVTWSYDNTYQFTRERRDGDYSYDVTYTYDAVGNRATKLSGGTTTTYTYDAANKMTRFEDNTGITTFAYDNNGNQITKTVPGGSIATYAYNYQNKMTGITYPDSSLNTFTYDGDGKRLRKQDSGATLRYVYDNQGPTGLYDLVEEMNDEDTLQAFYTQGPMLLAMRRGGASYFYHDDALGSTSAISDSDETATSTYKYYAFGDLRTSTGTLTNPFKFVGGLGYYDDPDSGLMLLRARYCWAGVGRFTTPDPVLRETDDPDGPIMAWVGNAYVYAHDEPAQTSDPTGLWEWKPIHLRMTYRLARNTSSRVGTGIRYFGRHAAHQIADADADVDMLINLERRISALHFNKPLVFSLGLRDTSEAHRRFFNLAVAASREPLGRVNCTYVFTLLGVSLHPLQDNYAHMCFDPCVHSHVTNDKPMDDENLDLDSVPAGWQAWSPGWKWKLWPLTAWCWSRAVPVLSFKPGRGRVRQAEVATAQALRRFLERAGACFDLRKAP